MRNIKLWALMSVACAASMLLVLYLVGAPRQIMIHALTNGVPIGLAGSAAGLFIGKYFNPTR